ncbi:MAG TPA: hypothetical protein VHE78_06010 [Gemmatimonadaceae bacterium]|nr:hypothetical protein [Gemmatimonadaceae bacterium]
MTGADPHATDVDLANPVASSVAELGAIDPPRPTPPSRLAPVENMVFMVNARLIAFKCEGLDGRL